MPERASSGKAAAIRGPVLTYTGDPFKNGLEHTMVYESDAIVAMVNGAITHFGPADRIRRNCPPAPRSRIMARILLFQPGSSTATFTFPKLR